MEDLNPGKYYKDKLKDYESSFDLEAMFDKIDPEINPKKKRRLVPFWFWGCGSIVGLMGIVTLIYFMYPNSDIPNANTAVAPNQNMSKFSDNAQSESTAELNAVFKEEKPILDVNKLKIHSENRPTRLSSKEQGEEAVLEMEIVHVSEKIIKINKEEKAKIGTEMYSNITGSQLDQEIENSSSIEKDKLKIIDGLLEEGTQKTFLDMPLLPVTALRAFSSPVDFQIYPQVYVEKRLYKYDTDLWSISIGGSYLSIFKSNEFVGQESRPWFEQYAESQEIYPGYSVDLNVARKISGNLSVSSSFMYNVWQERNSFSFSDSTITFDTTLPNTIYVDRDGVPFDTIFGQNKIDINSNFSSLVSNHSMMGIGLGFKYDKELGEKWIIVPEAHVVSLFYKSTGNVMDLDGEIIERKDFNLNMNEAFVSKWILSSAVGFSFNYRLAESIDIGLRSQYVSSFNAFTSGNALREKRNFFKLGLQTTLHF